MDLLENIFYMYNALDIVLLPIRYEQLYKTEVGLHVYGQYQYFDTMMFLLFFNMFFCKRPTHWTPPNMDRNIKNKFTHVSSLDR